jgi:GR25 family glycosyltransferase involved in LPS biosynthesis
MNKPIIIMEDDAILHKQFNKHVNQIIDNLLPKEWDIVLLSYNFDSILSFKTLEDCHCTFGKHKIDVDEFVHSKINTTIAKLNNVFGVAAYMIHPNGAKRFKKDCFPMNHTILHLPYLNMVQCYTLDMMMNTVYKDMNAYVCIFPIVMTLHGQEGYKSVAFS